MNSMNDDRFFDLAMKLIARQYTEVERAELESLLSKQPELRAELDRLKGEADKAAKEQKAEAKAKIEATHKKYAQAEAQLDKAENATEATWNDVKAKFRKSYDDLKDSVDKTRRWLSEKIKP